MISRKTQAELDAQIAKFEADADKHIARVEAEITKYRSFGHRPHPDTVRDVMIPDLILAAQKLSIAGELRRMVGKVEDESPRDVPLQGLTPQGRCPICYQPSHPYDCR